jgi:hypothetical protein
MTFASALQSSSCCIVLSLSSIWRAKVMAACGWRCRLKCTFLFYLDKSVILSIILTDKYVQGIDYQLKKLERRQIP